MTEIRVHVREQLDTMLDQLPVGARLPGERDLAARFGVARMTLRHCLDALVVSGRLARRPGSGTYVAAPVMSHMIGLTSFTEDIASRGAVPGSRVVEFRRRRASRETAIRLSIPIGEPVQRVTRVRTADGLPIAVEAVDIPASYVEGLREEECDGSLYALLLTRFGIQLGGATMAIEPTLPDSRIADLLEIDVSHPLLLVHMTDVDTRGRTVMHARCHYRGDRYRFTASLASTLHRGSP